MCCGESCKVYEDTQMKEPLVSICCMAYNHASYIRQCLDGFMMQKTNFSFEVLIHDDASTDGTQEIIREYVKKYPDVIKPIYQVENQYSKGIKVSITYNYPRTKGKYIALCEGDDYWIDPLKLQKQVDVLETDSSIGMVYTKVKLYDDSKKKVTGSFGGNYRTFEELIQKNTIPTLSVLVRTNLVLTYQQEICPEKYLWKMGDYPMWLWISRKSQIYFLSEETGVYRVLPESASHSKNPVSLVSFIISVYDIKKYFSSIYLPALINHIEQERMWWLLIDALLTAKLSDTKNISSYLKNNSQYHYSIDKKIIINLAYYYPMYAEKIVCFYMKYFFGR